MSGKILGIVLLLLAALAVWLLPGREGHRTPDRPTTEDPLAAPVPSGTVAARPGSEDPDKPPVAAVTGRVIDAMTGAPIPGASVVLRQEPEEEWGTPWIGPSRPEPPRELGRATTDSSGGFDLGRAGPADWEVVVRKDGYFAETRDWLNDLPLEFQLRREEVLGFRVEDLRERPVEGAEVLVFSEAESSLPPERRVTDEEGRFRAPVEKDDTFLIVRADGFATRRVGQLDDLEDAAIVLFPGLSIRGEVVDSAGGPIAGAEVILHALWWKERLRTGPDGRFSFAALPDSEQVSVSAHREDLAHGGAEVHPGDQAVRIVLGPKTPRGAISGRVRGWAEVEPMTVTARFRPHDDIEREDFFTVERDGTFTIEPLDPGRYVLEVGVGELEYMPLFPPTVETHRARAVVDVPPGGRVEGIVLTPEPVAYSFACVRILSPAGFPVEDHVRVYCVTPGPWSPTVAPVDVGRCVIPLELPPGTPVHVRADPKEAVFGLPATVLTKTSPTMDGKPTDLKLPGPTRLVVEVLGPDGPFDPVEDNVWCSFCQDVGRFVQGWQMVLHGGAALRPDRAFRLRVEAEGYARFHREYGPPGPGERRITVVLAPAASVSLRLATPGGAPVTRAGVKVRLVLESGEVVRAGFGEVARGLFRSESLPPGHATLTVWCPPRRLRGEMGFDLEAGEVKDLGTLVLHPVEPIRGRVLGEDGQPVSGMAVCLKEVDAGWSHPTTATGPDGRFALHWPSGDDPVIEVWDRAGETVAAIRPGPDAERKEHVIRLPGLGEVVALFPDPPVLVPRESARQVTREDGFVFVPSREEIRGEDGRLVGYRLFPLPAGTYTIGYDGLAVDGSGYVVAGEATVRPGESTEVVLRRSR